MAAPGVVVSTATRSGPTGVVRAASGQYFAVGLAERGPVDAPVRISSLGDYRRLFGERVAYGSLYDDLALYFETGGEQAHVLRLVGPAATSGTLTLDDRAGVPDDTVTFDAAAPGAWSSRLKVIVSAGTTPDTVRIQITLDGEVVESYNNLATVAAIVTRFAKSPYVRASDEGSLAAGVTALPAVTAADGVALTAGTDDRAAVNAASVATGLELMKIGLGDGAVAAPGFGETVHAALIEHARTHRRVAILAGPKGASRDDLKVLGDDLGATPGAESAGLFGGWLQVSDGAGGLRLISPEGYIAGSRAKAHSDIGPWAVAAGEGSISPYIVGTDLDVSAADALVLHEAHVNPIRIVAGKLRLYGWRSLSRDPEYDSLTVMDTLNRLVTECELRLEPFVFKTIPAGGKLQSQMAGILIGVLEPIRTAGGIFERRADDGALIDPGYSVDVSTAINTIETLANNEIHAVVAVRLSPNASTILLTIVKAGLAAAV